MKLFTVFFKSGRWHVCLEHGSLACGSKSEAELIADLLRLEHEEKWNLTYA